MLNGSFTSNNTQCTVYTLHNFNDQQLLRWYTSLHHVLTFLENPEIIFDIALQSRL